MLWVKRPAIWTFLVLLLLGPLAALVLPAAPASANGETFTWIDKNTIKGTGGDFAKNTVTLTNSANSPLVFTASGTNIWSGCYLKLTLTVDPSHNESSGPIAVDNAVNGATPCNNNIENKFRHFTALQNVPASFLNPGQTIPIGCPGGPAGPIPRTANYPCPGGGAVVNGVYTANPGNPGGGIAGKVTYNAAGNTGLCITGTATVSGASPAPIQNGNYHVTDIPPGPVTVNVSDCKDAAGNSYSGQSGPITVVSSQTVGGDFTITGLDSGPAASDPKPNCDAGSFSWLICEAIRQGLNAIDYILNHVLYPLLQNDALQAGGGQGTAYAVWAAIRNLADVAFVLIFMLTIFGTALGLDNYTIKKMLPRLIAAAVLIQFSWYICGFIIDIGNVLGAGLKALLDPIVTPVNAQNVIDLSNFGQNATFSAAIIGGGFALVGGIAGLGVATVSSALVILIVAFATLVLRKIIIILLVVLSPIALLLWVLPNTQKFFKEWRDTLVTLVIMYPMVVLLFEAGRLFSAVAPSIAGQSGYAPVLRLAAILPFPVFFAANGQSALVPLFQLAGYVMPLIMIPFVFSLAGRIFKAGNAALGKVGGGLDKRFGGKTSNLAKRRAALRSAENAMTLQDPKAGAAKKWLARKRGGFDGNGLGFTIPGTKIGGDRKKLQAMQDRSARGIAASEEQARAKDGAVKQFYDKYGQQRPQDIIAEQQRLELDKLENARVGQILLGEVTIDSVAADGTVTAKTAQLGNVDLGDDSVKKSLASTIMDSSTDPMTRIAYMQSLARSAGGQQLLAEILATPVSQGGFGGDVTNTVWRKGVANVKADSSPDLIKGAGGFMGVSGEELAAMNPAAKARYLTYASQAGNEHIASEAAVAISEIAANDRLRSRMGKDDWEKMHGVITQNSNFDTRAAQVVAQGYARYNGGGGASGGASGGGSTGGGPGPSSSGPGPSGGGPAPSGGPSPSSGPAPSSGPSSGPASAPAPITVPASALHTFTTPSTPGLLSTPPAPAPAAPTTVVYHDSPAVVLEQPAAPAGGSAPFATPGPIQGGERSTLLNPNPTAPTPGTIIAPAAGRRPTVSARFNFPPPGGPAAPPSLTDPATTGETDAPGDPRSVN